MAETQRFAAWWATNGDTRLGGLKPLSNWLVRAEPMERSAAARAPLGEGEITSRVARYRQNIAYAEVAGKRWLADENVDELCWEYEQRLRGLQ
jgi:hypothetical protein